jgi:hypothetical protein
MTLPYSIASTIAFQGIETNIAGMKSKENNY